MFFSFYIPRIIGVTIDYSLAPAGEVTVTPQCTEQQCGELPTGSSLIPTRLRHEKAHHDARGVEADGLRKAAARIAAEPGVAAPFDQPLLRDGSAVGIFHCRAADAAALDWPVEVASRERSLSALDLIENVFAVDRIDRAIGQPVKDDLADMPTACGERRGVEGRGSLHRGEGGGYVG